MALELEKSPAFLSKGLQMGISTFTLADSETKPPSSKRCCASECKRKLGLTDFDCKCGVRYCATHRLPEAHSCSYDYKSFGKTLLEKQLVKVDGSATKLERI